MHVGVIGGGLMGSAIAFFLAEAGQQVTLLEQNADVGGLHRLIDFGNQLSVPRFQHSIIPQDRHIAALTERFGMTQELTFHTAPFAMVFERYTMDVSSPWHMVRFGQQSLSDRLSLVRTLINIRHIDWRVLDTVPICDWLIEVGGRSNFENIWQPLLESKFDFDYESIPATFLWSWVQRISGGGMNLRYTPQGGLLRHGLQSMIGRLISEVRRKGGSILTEARVREIQLDGQRLDSVRTHNGLHKFDAVVTTLSTPDSARLLLAADEQYRARLASGRYMGLVCPVLVLDRPLSKYWTLTMSDSSSPFSSIIQHPHPLHPHLYITYLPKYTAPDNDWQGVEDEVIWTAWMDHLQQLFPDLRADNIKHRAISRERYVQAAYTLNAASDLPAVVTPYDGVFLANISQIYPQLVTADSIIAHAHHVVQSVLQHRSVAISQQPA